MTVEPTADLGDIIAHLTEPQDPPVITGPWWPRTTDALPVLRDRALEMRDTEIVGRLTALLKLLAADADYYQVPADMRGRIDQAQRIAAGDLPEWQPAEDRRAA